MSESDEVEPTELHPELAALLRDEPVAVDPQRREQAIDAALELAATLYPPTADTPTDELAARRQLAPVPAPRRAAGERTRRVVLVAAAVVVVAGLGIAGLVANRDTGDVMSSGADSAETPALDSSASTVDDAARSGDAAQDQTDGATAAEAAPPDATALEGAEGFATTTSPMTSAAPVQLGEFDSVESLLDATAERELLAGSVASLDTTARAALPACPAATVEGLAVIGGATVGSVPVWVAVTSDATVVVVLDVATCAELGRR